MYFIKKIVQQMHLIGIDIKKLLSVKYLFKYFLDRKKWKSQGGTISQNLIVLTDVFSEAGSSSGHYFHQDLLIANKIFNANPKKHLDIGSRIDGFVAHVASFRMIEIADIRPLKKKIHQNIEFRQIDLMNYSGNELYDSISSLHAIEHFGLGRYGDEINPVGHIHGLENIIKLLKPGGNLYISFPIGNNDEVFFNAHRVFHPTSILAWEPTIENLKLTCFDFVDDNGDLHECIDPSETKSNYGCGIYTFEKVN